MRQPRLYLLRGGAVPLPCPPRHLSHHWGIAYLLPDRAGLPGRGWGVLFPQDVCGSLWDDPGRVWGDPGLWLLRVPRIWRLRQLGCELREEWMHLPHDDGRGHSVLPERLRPELGVVHQ